MFNGKISFFPNEGDLKNILQIYGLSAASSAFPCVFCKMTKDDFASSKLMRHKKFEIKTRPIAISHVHATLYVTV